MASTHSEDDGFHEIQLNGKQLAFLFMAATVVSVVIFLCGVLVGRGVRAERTTAEAAALSTAPAADVRPEPAPAQQPAAVPTGGDPTAVAPPPAVDDANASKRPEPEPPAVEDVRPDRRNSAAARPAPEPPSRPAAEVAPAKPEKPQPKAEKPQPKPEKVLAESKPAPEPPAVAEDAKPLTPPEGQGYVVQIAALNVRSEADAIAKRLASKGYSAFVVAPADGAPRIFRVRVGMYKTKREADSIAAKLEREEQVKPWVTR